MAAHHNVIRKHLRYTSNITRNGPLKVAEKSLNS